VPREKVLALLRQHWAEIQAKFGVERLMLFGSTARGEAHAGSDIDLLVRFSAPPGYDGYFALKCYLEALLGALLGGAARRACGLGDGGRAASVGAPAGGAGSD
jgi:predicted nucleotidyltransferase